MRVLRPHASWPWVGLLIGWGVGIADMFLFLLLGIDMTLASYDATVAVTGFYSLSFGGLGFIGGKLLLAREQARQDAQTIRAQFDALEASQLALLQNEKLAAI